MRPSSTELDARSSSQSHAERYPYGECECRDGCQCAGIPGPAAELVTRGERRMRVCTRCSLSGDREREWLLTKDSPSEPFTSYDALGVFCAALHLAEKTEPETESSSQGQEKP